MCGFVGLLNFKNSLSVQNSEVVLKKMTDAIIHRGPDDEGFWFNQNKNIALGFRRLAIVDLSEAGHQPMHSPSGQYVIVFNGEIYNHLDLRKQIQFSNWRGHSDTETLLACFEEWGVQKTIENTIGMFAMAIWDQKLNSLTLVRDRIGEKPLYYGWQGDTFLFGSELKALKKHPNFNAQIDRNSLCLLLRHNYIPAPHTIYDTIFKLAPGCIASMKVDTIQIETKKYWSILDVLQNRNENYFTDDSKIVIDELESLLKNAVQKQMVADVPLGAFLSGGIDSSTIVALMQAQSSKPIKTFTIGFEDEAFNEAIYAKEVARHLKTEHTEFYVNHQQALDVIPLLSSIYDEPFADSSQIPTYLVSSLAKKHVTVSLSGDAGDELFCGYNRYLYTEKLSNKIKWLPAIVAKILSKLIYFLSVDQWNGFAKIFPKKLTGHNFGEKLHKGAKLLGGSKEELYYSLVSLWDAPQSLVLHSQEPKTILTDYIPELNKLTSIERMMVLDLLTYLPDDILVKVDRAAMGVSLESRVPFLDHRVVEFAWQVPQKFKLHKNKSKWVLRQLLYRYVPEKLIERPKMGFGIPLDAWLRGPLRNWAEALINEGRLQKEGYFNHKFIQKAWQSHLSGKRNLGLHLWSFLMFQSWLENQNNA